MQRVLGKAVVSATDIKVDGNETLFEFPQPLYLSAGTRYAIVLITGGAHSVVLVEGTKYSQGTLFYSTDGEYFQGDFTKDLMMTLYYAQFSNPRTVVELGTVSLAEGIAAFSLLTEAIIPDATSLVLEYQPSGSGDWIPLTDGTTDSLLGLPAMVSKSRSALPYTPIHLWDHRSKGWTVDGQNPPPTQKGLDHCSPTP